MTPATNGHKAARIREAFNRYGFEKSDKEIAELVGLVENWSWEKNKYIVELPHAYYVRSVRKRMLRPPKKQKPKQRTVEFKYTIEKDGWEIRADDFDGLVIGVRALREAVDERHIRSHALIDKFEEAVLC